VRAGVGIKMITIVSISQLTAVRGVLDRSKGGKGELWTQKEKELRGLLLSELAEEDPRILKHLPYEESTHQNQ